MEPASHGGMDPHWLKLRWPITVLVLGMSTLALLMRSSQHPIQLRLVLSFAQPLNLSGTVQGVLSIPDTVRVEPTRSVDVKVTEHAPIDLSVLNRTPVQVQVSNPNPIQIKLNEDKPMQVDVNPEKPVKVNVGL